MKRCPHCDATKPFDDFTKCRTRKDGYACYCRPCMQAKLYQHRYGISLEEIQNLWASQGCRCAICQRAEWSERSGMPFVDHDHETGAIRGLLCYSCNTALGCFQDDIARLSRAITYLQERAVVAA